jgi:hypothetical protein
MVAPGGGGGPDAHGPPNESCLRRPACAVEAISPPEGGDGEASQFEVLDGEWNGHRQATSGRGVS